MTDSKATTTDAGARVASDEHSLTIGADGPIVLNDHYLIEQMANFNRERIPERQPHAKGGGAFGHFQVTHDVSRYTRAAVFQPGTKADPERTDEAGLWYADGDMVRKAYTLRAEDDDFGQAGTMVRRVLDDAARARLVSNIVGHLKDGVSEPVLARAFDYWRKVDNDLGERIAAGVREE